MPRLSLAAMDAVTALASLFNAAFFLSLALGSRRPARRGAAALLALLSLATLLPSAAALATLVVPGWSWTGPLPGAQLDALARLPALVASGAISWLILGRRGRS